MSAEPHKWAHLRWLWFWILTLPLLREVHAFKVYLCFAGTKGMSQDCLLQPVFTLITVFYCTVTLAWFFFFFLRRDSTWCLDTKVIFKSWQFFSELVSVWMWCMHIFFLCLTRGHGIGEGQKHFSFFGRQNVIERSAVETYIPFIRLASYCLHSHFWSHY